MGVSVGGIGFVEATIRVGVGVGDVTRVKLIDGVVRIVRIGSEPCFVRVSEMLGFGLADRFFGIHAINANSNPMQIRRNVIHLGR